MKQFETFLLYTTATREKNFPLHLEATNALIKYFFAHDHLNYARLLPLYLSSMKHVEHNHPNIWQEFMAGKLFCVTKSQIPFTSIGPDHALEQENRRLKVNGGVIGITQNENALRRFFLIAPELKRLCLKFEDNIGVSMAGNRSVHHEVHGSKLERMSKNKTKLQEIILARGNPFGDSSYEIMNLLTHAVLPDNVAKDIINRDEEGQKLFTQFVEYRLKAENISAWDEMKKRKMGTFAHCNAIVEVKNGDKVMKLKEERGLLQRFLIAARCRPQLDLKECIATYEFGIIPRSLFSTDGSLLLPTDKSKIMKGLEELPVGINEGPSIDVAPHVNSFEGVIPDLLEIPTENMAGNKDNNSNGTLHKVILFDGMEIVNSMEKTSHIETCSDYSNAFIDVLVSKCRGYDEVHLIFDRYLDKSMKTKMRSKITQGASHTYYHVSDSTFIKHISLKDVLSDVRTKAELCEYLARKVLNYSRNPQRKLGNIIVT